MDTETWMLLKQAIESIKDCKGAMKHQPVRFAVRDLERVLDRTSGDDEKPGVDDD